MPLDGAKINGSLIKLREARPAIFGSDAHAFLLNAPLSEEEVQRFEKLHAVRLPGEYRYFLTRVGNGGAGPFYGVFPLGMMDDGFRLTLWAEDDGSLGILSRPFPHDDEWNDLSGKPDEISDLEASDYDACYEKFTDRYWSGSIMNGAIPICHAGCALRIWLVVTGPEAGHLWFDKRADLGGVMPLSSDVGLPLTFDAWYEEWLEGCLRNAGLAP